MTLASRRPRPSRPRSLGSLCGACRAVPHPAEPGQPQHTLFLLVQASLCLRALVALKPSSGRGRVKAGRRNGGPARPVWAPTRCLGPGLGPGASGMSRQPLKHRDRRRSESQAGRGGPTDRVSWAAAGPKRGPEWRLGEWAGQPGPGNRDQAARSRQAAGPGRRGRGSWPSHNEEHRERLGSRIGSGWGGQRKRAAGAGGGERSIHMELGSIPAWRRFPVTASRGA